MAYKNWNKNKINSQIDLLTKANPSSDEIMDLENLQSFLNDTYEVDQDIPFRRAFKVELEMLGIHKEFLRDIVKFAKKSKSFPTRAFENKQIDFFDDFIMDTLYDFYTNVDPEISRIFKTVFKERYNNFKFNKTGENFSHNIKSLGYTYLTSSKDDSYSTLLNIIHEYGHAISFRMERIEGHDYYPYSELMPMFMECIAADKIAKWISDNCPGDEHEIYKALGAEYQYMVRASDDLSYIIDYYNYVDEIKFKKYVIEDLMELSNISKNKADRILREDITLKLKYVPAYLVVIELYYLYKKDPQKALFLLKRFVQTKKREKYIPNLNINHIYLNEHSKEFTKELTKKIKGH